MKLANMYDKDVLYEHVIKSNSFASEITNYAQKIKLYKKQHVYTMSFATKIKTIIGNAIQITNGYIVRNERMKI